MKKKKINSILLGILIAIVAMGISLLLQYFVIDHLAEIFYKQIISSSKSAIENVESIVSVLAKNAQQMNFFSRILFAFREIITYLFIYYSLKILGKKYSMGILKLHYSIITMLVVFSLPIIYIVWIGKSIQVMNIFYTIISIAFYTTFIYLFLVDKEEADILVAAYVKNKKEKGKKIEEKKDNKKGKINIKKYKNNSTRIQEGEKKDGNKTNQKKRG